MVHLDRRLLLQAERYVTGEDIHRVREMIFAYKQAVDLHNRHWSGHRKYKRRYETLLRRYVFRRRIETVSRALRALTEQSSKNRSILRTA